MSENINSTLETEVIEAIRSCYDPEIPLNVYDLGLIYNIDIDPDNNVIIDMTLTSPNCPSIESLPNEVKQRVLSVDAVKEVQLNLVWEPPFSTEMMSEEAKLSLGML
jgi:FeS assembly SUF system protein